MQILSAFLVGVLVAGGAWLLLSRDLYRVVLGLMLITTAANLVLLSAGRLDGLRSPALVSEDIRGAPARFAVDPVPQAFVLTAIVIAFGVFAFLLGLIWAANRKVGTLDVQSMRLAEPESQGEP